MILFDGQVLDNLCYHHIHILLRASTKNIPICPLVYLILFSKIKSWSVPALPKILGLATVL